jgi:excisionase family DNA binding protein
MESNGGISMPFLQNDEVLTTDEAIAYLRISKPTFLKYVHLGKIRAVKAGKGWRVLESELARFLKGEDVTEREPVRQDPHEESSRPAVTPLS